MYDSSRKLIVERPSKFELLPPSNSGLALNAVDEHEEARDGHEQRVSSHSVHQPSFRSGGGKNADGSESLSLSGSLASRSRQVPSRLTTAKIEVDDLDKKESNFHISRSSLSSKSKGGLPSSKKGAGNVTYHSEKDPTDFDG